MVPALAESPATRSARIGTEAERSSRTTELKRVANRNSPERGIERARHQERADGVGEHRRVILDAGYERRALDALAHDGRSDPVVVLREYLLPVGRPVGQVEEPLPLP